MNTWGTALGTALVIEGVIGMPAYVVRQFVWEKIHKDHINDRFNQVQDQIGNLALGLSSDIRFSEEQRMNLKQLFDGIKPQTKGVTMEIYRQGDDRWATKNLGPSPFIMRGDGCYVACAAQLLLSVGYNVTPGDVCDALNANGGFTDDGEVIHAKLTEAYPYFKYVDEATTTQLVAGNWGKNSHFLAAVHGAEYDPWYGLEQAPAGFKELGRQNISIDPVAPVVAPFEAHEVTVISDSGAHVRQAPNTESAIINPGTHQPVEAHHTAALTKGATFTAIKVVEGETIDGSNLWYESQFGNYVLKSLCSE